MERGGETQSVRARLFVLSAGAINSAVLLLRSASTRHPNGLANSSGAVGRYYMSHNCTALMTLMPIAGERDALSQDARAQRLLLRRRRQRQAAGQSANAGEDPGADAARRAAARPQMAARVARAPQRRLVRRCRRTWGIGTARCVHTAERQYRAQLAAHEHARPSPVRGYCEAAVEGHRLSRRSEQALRRRHDPRTSAAPCASATIQANAPLDPYCRAYDHDNLICGRRRVSAVLRCAEPGAHHRGPGAAHRRAPEEPRCASL